MLISIIVYMWLFSGQHGLGYGLKFSIGFCVLMLVHELGHSFAMKYYGLSASPPIFIPFLGAVINLRQPPRNALEEAVVGIGGPYLGTVGAMIVYLMSLQAQSAQTAELLRDLAGWGFLLNLFNMLPVPPLDGGRITAAVSPWIWIPGLLGAVALAVSDWMQTGFVNPIFILLLLAAWPRIKMVLSMRRQRLPYYDIGKASKILMAGAYIALGLFLAGMHVIGPI
jgi:Zn-dependent protease